MSETSIPLREMFPDVQSDKIKTLLESDDFVAHRALIALYESLKARQEAGENVSELLKLSEEIYTPSIQALQEKMHAEGYNSADVSAAMLVSEGRVNL